VTDNPLLFPDTETVLSAGNFHGQPVALVMDYAKLAICFARRRESTSIGRSRLRRAPARHTRRFVPRCRRWWKIG
jgi:histidine ammonia-lyase